MWPILADFVMQVMAEKEKIVSGNQSPLLRFKLLYTNHPV